MTFSSTQIEVITQSVLRELRSRGVAIAAEHSSDPRPEVRPGADVLASGCGLNEKVITEDTLAAAEAAGRTVHISPGAVITPSGHDYIRRHGVTVTSSGKTNSPVADGTVIVMEDSPAALSAATTAGWQTDSAGCEFEAASKAKTHLSGPVVCSVEEPSTTACLLNRSVDIRAAVITHTTDIRLLGSVMNPHVICLSPAGWSFAALLKLLRHLTAVDREVPAKWKELSGGSR